MATVGVPLERRAPAKHSAGYPRPLIFCNAVAARREELLRIYTFLDAASCLTASMASGNATLPSCSTPNWSSNTPCTLAPWAPSALLARPSTGCLQKSQKRAKPALLVAPHSVHVSDAPVQE